MEGPGLRCGKSQVTDSDGGDGGWRHQTREPLDERGVDLDAGRVVDDALQLLVPRRGDGVGAEPPGVARLPDDEPLRSHGRHDPACRRELVAPTEPLKDLPLGRPVVGGLDGRSVGLGRLRDDAEDGDLQLHVLCAQSNLLPCRCAALPLNPFGPDEMRISR